jgi:hypothetical protein
MLEVHEEAHDASVAKGHVPTPNAGAKSKKMAQWQAMGRSLVDIRTLVFNLGRTDFRDKYLIACTKRTQSSTTVGSSKFAESVQTSHAMMEGIAVLVAVRGIVRFVQSLFQAYHLGWHGSNRLTSKSFWRICFVLLSHAAWRVFPLLTRHLPEILLGGTMCGVPLSTSPFETEADVSAHPKIYVKRERAHAHREIRFHQTVQALDELLKWAKTERHNHVQRVLGSSFKVQRLAAASAATGGLPDTRTEAERRRTPDWTSVMKSAEDDAPLLAVAAQQHWCSSSSLIGHAPDISDEKAVAEHLSKV